MIATIDVISVGMIGCVLITFVGFCARSFRNKHGNAEYRRSIREDREWAEWHANRSKP